MQIKITLLPLILVLITLFFCVKNKVGQYLQSSVNIEHPYFFLILEMFQILYHCLLASLMMAFTSLVLALFWRLSVCYMCL